MGYGAARDELHRPSPRGCPMNAPRALWWSLALVVLFAAALRMAWLGDDAYITLRSVENWVSGNGLRWNAADRVQTYTHPAWMLLLSAGRWLTGESYLTTIVISLLLSVLAMAMLLARAATGAALLASTLLLLGTRAFVEYSTSGLETPLSYVLLVAFAAVIVRTEVPPVVRMTKAVLLVALLCTNRMDLGLLCAPAVLSTVRSVPFRAVVVRGALASLPFLGWLCFAVLYYGSPFPVTAHAKAFGVGIPAADLAVQGLHYARFALVDDPLLLPVVGLGLGIGLWQATTRWLALGALCYCGYVVKVGGDFMAGRFFLPPFVVAMAVLVPWLSKRSRALCITVAIFAVAAVLWRGVPPWLRTPPVDPQPTDALIEAQHGVADERAVYWPQLGLWSPTRGLPQWGMLDALARPDGTGGRWILLNGAVGSAGFNSGHQGHVLDPLLCDPLLTRLPARDPKRWRIGHVLRRIPEGYYESLATGENRLLHPGLRAYYDALRSLTRDPVFAPERLRYLWRMALGEFDAGFRAFIAEHYHRPPRVSLALADLPAALPFGVYWFDEPRVRIVYDGGLSIGLDGRTHRARELHLQALGGEFFAYRIRFLRDGPVVGEALAYAQPPAAGLSPLQATAGLGGLVVPVPADIEFDTVWIDAQETRRTHQSPGPPGIGALRLVE
jgi:arabinofuranosyltransferase